MLIWTAATAAALFLKQVDFQAHEPEGSNPSEQSSPDFPKSPKEVLLRLHGVQQGCDAGLRLEFRLNPSHHAEGAEIWVMYTLAGSQMQELLCHVDYQHNMDRFGSIYSFGNVDDAAALIHPETTAGNCVSAQLASPLTSRAFSAFFTSLFRLHALAGLLGAQLQYDGEQGVQLRRGERSSGVSLDQMVSGDFADADILPEGIHTGLPSSPLSQAISRCAPASAQPPSTAPLCAPGYQRKCSLASVSDSLQAGKVVPGCLVSDSTDATGVDSVDVQSPQVFQEGMKPSTVSAAQASDAQGIKIMTGPNTASPLPEPPAGEAVQSHAGMAGHCDELAVQLGDTALAAALPGGEGCADVHPKAGTAPGGALETGTAAGGDFRARIDGAKPTGSAAAGKAVWKASEGQVAGVVQPTYDKGTEQGAVQAMPVLCASAVAHGSPVVTAPKNTAAKPLPLQEGRQTRAKRKGAPEAPSGSQQLVLEKVLQASDFKKYHNVLLPKKAVQEHWGPPEHELSFQAKDRDGGSHCWQIRPQRNVNKLKYYLYGCQPFLLKSKSQTGDRFQLLKAPNGTYVVHVERHQPM